MKKPIYKRWWFIALAVIIVLGGIGAALGGGDDPGKDTGTPNAGEDENKDKDMTTDEQLASIFEDLFGSKEVDDFKLSYDDTEKKYVVAYTPTEQFWDETAFMRTGMTDYVLFCKKAYAISDVTAVDFEISTTLTDAKGNDAVEPVLSILMPKSEFDSFNWDNLEYQDIYDSFVQSCTLFWAHPAIINNADLTEIYYAP